MSSPILNLLTDLQQSKIEFWVEDNKLRLRGNRGALSAALQAQLQKHKDEIIQILQKSARPGAQNHNIVPPITAVQRTQELPLSFAQQRLWFIDRFEGPSPTYNIPLTLRLEGALNTKALQQALNEIVARHEVLRTTFPSVNGQASQHICPTLQAPLHMVELQDLTIEERCQRLQSHLHESARHTFDLAKGPLIKATLYRLSATEHIFLLNQHHIISDGWSLGVLLEELSVLYQAFKADLPSPLPSLKIQYADFAIWQRGWLQGEVLAHQLDYWRSQLADAPTMLTLPTDHPRPPVQSFKGNTFSFVLDPNLVAELKQLSQTQGASLFMTLYAGFAILLARYSGQDDIVIGSPIANRHYQALEPLLGFFVNTLALRVDLAGQPTFAALLNQVRQTTLDAYSHQDIPFEQLVAELNIPRNLSHTPLFQVMIAFHNITTNSGAASNGASKNGASKNGASNSRRIGDLQVSPVEFEGDIAHFDLTLDVYEQAGQLRASLGYNTDLFEATTIERMAGHLQTLLASIVANPNQAIGDLQMLSAGERRQLLMDWNNTQANEPIDGRLHRLFEEQAARTPNAIALVLPAAEAGQQSIEVTYQELNARANQLARYLQTLGAGPEVWVGICLERSVDMVVGVLGILKAGGAYVPLDPNYPKERLAFILDDAQISLLITQSALKNKLPPTQSQFVYLDEDWGQIGALPTDAPDVMGKPEHLAYLIYTSGSTGLPKGVMIEHQAAVEHLQAVITAYQMTPQDRVLQFASLSVDAAQEQIFSALSSGAGLVIQGKEIWTVEAFNYHALRQKLTVVDLPPPYLQQLVNAWLVAPPAYLADQLRLILVGGEAIPTALLRAWQQLGVDHIRLLNVYGPTEATITATCFDFTEYQIDDSTLNLPIGQPLPGRSAYILDSRQQLVPIGVAGELHLGGAGIARGYLNQPVLTQEKFIPFPAAITSNTPAASAGRLYKTGDLVRWLPTGQIEFLGRIDQQVKLRGFRIELGEIEAVLAQHPLVQEAVVVLHEQDGAKQLVAYVVVTPTAMTGDTHSLSGNSASLQVTNLPAEGPALWRTFLQDRLPDYMAPRVFVIVDKFPLTPNGKIDRSALPAPDTLQLVRDREFAPPQTETEKILARVWEEVLGLDRIGRFDNFFELGGDSIISLQVVSRAQAEGVHLTPRQLFQEQTVAELARVAQHESLVQAEQGLVTGDLPLTPIQHWFFARYQQNPHHFNQSALLPLEQGIEPELLLQAVRLLLAHHDGLRLRFSPSQQGWQQHLGGQAPELALRYFADHTQCTLHSEDIVSVFNLSSVAEPQRALAAINQKLQASLNISAGPLMRLAVIQMGPGQVDLLLWVIHHLAVDLVSWRLLIPDLWTVYQQLKQGQTPQLAAKSSSLKAWATWLNDYAQEEALQAELAYWRKVSEQVRPLPIDKPAEGAQATVASSANVQVSLTEAETHALLQDVPAIYHTQINDVLLTALALAFMEWTGDQRLVLDLEGHGRESLSDTLDLSRTVGWFTAIYPVCLQLPEAGRGGLGLGEALKSIKEQLRQIPNKGIGYGLLRYLNESSAAQLSSLPQAQVTFNYGGQFKAGPMQSLGGDLAGEQPLSHLIEINGAIADGQLSLQWSYSKTLFHVQTIERLAHRFISSLQELIAHCQLPESGGYTPSDFPLLDLNQIQLDNLVGRGENIAQIYPLSPMQGGMLFHTLYTPNDGAYFEQLSFHLFGLLDVARFQQAWQKVLDRHAALRTGFVWQKVDAPLQIVYQHLTFPWDIQDWRGLTSTEQESALRNLLAKERSKGFDVNRPPLMRFSLIRLGDTQYQVVLHSHHLLFDGWSMPVLFGELFSLYRDIQAVLPPPRPYQDYVAWLQKQDRSQAEKFWRERLAGFTAPTYLGVDSRKAGQAQGYQDYQLALSPELSEQLDTFARRHRLTANTIMQGCIALLLSKYSGETDVVFGVTVAGRPSDLPYSEQMVGLFINTLPLRVKIASEMAILTWLEQIQSDMIQQNEFAYSPLVDIQRWSDLPAGTNLFESIFVFENYPMDKAALTPIDDLQLGKFQAVEQTNYPLTIVALPGAQFSLKITYDDSRFEPTAIERMAGHLETLVASIVATPNQTIGDLPMLTARERRQILVDWNDTKSDYPADKLLHQLFEEQVERTPHKIAVVFEGAELTYRELNARANQLAHYLQHLGVRPETLVGICVERSLEMIVGLLGILKAGGAYVPLDPNYPTERLAFMLQDANVPLLLSQTHLRDSLPKTLAEIVCLDGDWDSIAHYPANNPTHRANPHNLAYVIYTSGSTGKPKGVPINHRGVTNLLHWHQQQFKITAKDQATQLASLAFDAAGWEIWPFLTAGARLFLLHPQLLSPTLLQNWLIVNQITVTYMPTPLAEELLRLTWPTNAPLRLLLTGGDTLHPITSADIPFGVINNYGPTENSIVTTSDQVELASCSPPPIGKAIANTQVYILDKQLQPLPIGVPGELYIAGDGLARGYLKQPGLTAEKFIPNPFARELNSPNPGVRLYKTGDLVRWLPDGNIEFIGRVDHQVKIRGFRIELGEIEAVLSQHPAVQEAMVVARIEASGQNGLVAYVTISDQFAMLQGEAPAIWRTFLQEKLPEYMVPNAFVMLEQFPITPNGKIDRKALPTPDSSSLVNRSEFVPSQTPTEALLAKIWANVLGVEVVGRFDNFFHLGGHSLLAIQLISQIETQFECRLPVITLFQNPTIAQFGVIINEKEQAQVRGSVVPLQIGSQQHLPFFCLPGAGALVSDLFDLAQQLDLSQTVYGLQPPGFDHDMPPLDTMGALLDYLLPDLQAINPMGPYYLGGHSAGGNIAFALALALQQQGHQAPLVALFDSLPPPTKGIAVPDHFAKIDEKHEILQVVMQQVKQHLDISFEGGQTALEAFNGIDYWDYLTDVFEQNNVASAQNSVTHIKRIVQTYQSLGKAVSGYTPDCTYKGQLILFQADDDWQPEEVKWLREEWQRVCEKPIIVHAIPGNHYTILDAPNVTAWGPLLATYLIKEIG